MAIKTAIGRVSGDLLSLNLGIVVWDDGGAEVAYMDALNVALGVAPADLFGLLPTGTPSVNERSRSIYEFEINYQPEEVDDSEPPTPPETGSLVRRANCQTKSKTLKHFLEPIGVFGSIEVYGPDGEVDADHCKHMRHAIDLARREDGEYMVNGHTFEPLPETRTLDYYLPNAEVTEEYLDLVEDLVSRGCFNSEEFFGKPPGTVQIVRFSLSERSPDDWELSFGFGYAPIREDVAIGGDITIPELAAWSYYWTLDKEVPEVDVKIVEVVPRLAFVGRVWEEDDFGALELEEE